MAPSAKVLVTNLHNFTQPLIRYELTDRFTTQEGAPYAGWLRASIDGRADEVFRYGSVVVHPHVIRSALASEAKVIEYQVRQTENGIDVLCVADGHLATAALVTRLEGALRQTGLSRPHVTMRQAKSITRDPHTGKVRRFIPMSGKPAETREAAR